jgi:hypothetical protein
MLPESGPRKICVQLSVRVLDADVEFVTVKTIVVVGSPENVTETVLVAAAD